MRYFASILLLPPTLTYATQIPSFQSFVAALPVGLEDYIPPTISNNSTESEDHDLLRRQSNNGCPKDFGNCANLGAPSLCCANRAVCSPDAAGNVACCPRDAECAGTVNGVITAGTVDQYGSVIRGSTVIGGAGGAATTSSFVYAPGSTTARTTLGLVPANGQSTSNTNGGFIVDGTSTVASPGAGVRSVEIPLLARLVIRALQYLPI